MFKTNLVYLNGVFMAPESAQVPVFDRGFVFGDGVYEVIPVYERKLFRLEQHLARLKSNLGRLDIVRPLSGMQWREVFHRLIEEGSGANQYLYLQVTRGVAARDHVFPEETSPTVLAYSMAWQRPGEAMRTQGVACITAEDNRWLNCDIKSISLLGNVLLKQLAVNAGALETILLRDGMLTEGSASNIFIVKDGLLMTPPTSRYLLSGVTRQLVLDLAMDIAQPFAEAMVAEPELMSADEIMLTSSTKEILPVTRLNGKAVGSGRPGPVYAALAAAYQAYVAGFGAAA